MMPTLRAASLRHLLRHPAQLALALIGLTLGVGTIVAVDVATASSQRAFELSLQAVNGAATHQITGGPRGIDERLYAQLRTQAAAGVPLRFAPLLTDIAQAQEWLGAVGRLSRIDVRVAGGAPDAALAWLRAHLPADLELHATRAQARETFAMTDAFTTNLKAMSLLALLVGAF